MISTIGNIAASLLKEREDCMIRSNERIMLFCKVFEKKIMIVDRPSFFQKGHFMAVALSDHVLGNPTLNSVLFIDQTGQIQIRDQNRAAEVLLLSDANSIEHKIIQIVMNLSLFRDNASLNEQNASLKERVTLGERQILHLLEENTKIQDELTERKMKEDAAVLSAAERRDGILDILATPIYIVVFPFMIFKLAFGLSKILVPGSFAMRARECQMDVYKTFHPNASLTERYTYAKENPLKYDYTDYFPLIEQFKASDPEGTYQEWAQYIEMKLPTPVRIQLKFDSRGPLGFVLTRVPHQNQESENSSGLKVILCEHDLPLGRKKERRCRI